MTARRFAASESAAEKLAERWQTTDPFPEIPPALLNSGDIRDYVAVTAMLWPFQDDEEKLKPASYEVDLEGPYVYFDKDGQRHSGDIERGKEFVLKANSIAFVTLEPTFRLPEYIALRFNLRITHVYRGLLLGTGPLIDPGFTGKLSIPLHNLTTNDYALVGGEGLIWVEFTKLSEAPLQHPLAGARPRQVPKRTRDSVPLPEAKKNRDVGWYLRKASPNRPVRSGIPKATAVAETAAREARTETQRFRRRLDFGALLAIVALASLVYAIFGLISGVDARLDKPPAVTERDIGRLEDRIRELESRLATPPAAPAPTPTSSP